MHMDRIFARSCLGILRAALIAALVAMTVYCFAAAPVLAQSHSPLWAPSSNNELQAGCVNQNNQLVAGCTLYFYTGYYSGTNAHTHYSPHGAAERNHIELRDGRKWPLHCHRYDQIVRTRRIRRSVRIFLWVLLLCRWSAHLLCLHTRYLDVRRGDSRAREQHRRQSLDDVEFRLWYL